MSETATPREPRDKTVQQRKIARQEWPSIVKRYRGGESFSSIARSYQCTAPAIRYIVHRGQDAEDYTNVLPSTVPSAGSHPPAIPVRRFSTAVRHTGQRTGTPELAGYRLDDTLRDATSVEIANFLVALDAAVTNPEPNDIYALRLAADRLMRMVARVRIAVEAAPQDRRDV
jgi:hypothetical protein